MKKKILMMLFLLITVMAGRAQAYLSGYGKSLSGEELDYHAPQPDAHVSLLVRSEDERRFIEWETDPVPAGYNDDHVTFLMLAGIDVNPADPHSWKLFIDGEQFFTINSPLDTLKKSLDWKGPGEALLEFRANQVDLYGDFMGYLFLHLPADRFERGKAVNIKVVGETAGSRTWFMVFKYDAVPSLKLEPEQAIIRGLDGNYQVLRASIVHYDDPLETTVTIGDRDISTVLKFGYNNFYLPVPVIEKDTLIHAEIGSRDKKQYIQDILVKPVKEMTIYLLHHSHNDIGYTHVQDEVEKMQWKNTEDAIQLAEKTQDYPPGSQLKWNVEVMWAVVSWLEQATPKEKASFYEAVRKGWIELDAFYANELTGLCNQEEMFRLMEPARKIARDCGVELRSAMITDIPGWSWGIVPALARSGVKYLSLGTNRGHRIGSILTTWGDKPFYWISPSGEEKILCWIHGEGYSLFHTGLDYKQIQKRLREDLIFGYMDELARKDYPYDMVTLRYNIGSDNGPADELLPDAVKVWNEKYVTPKIIISTVGEAFGIFEDKYGAQLPQVSGDFTGYWEDGAASTAAETAMNRRSADRLVQFQALCAMLPAYSYPEEKVNLAWRNILLFDEHTWGSWNSISEPESEFTKQQWEIKKSFAVEADRQSRQLMTELQDQISSKEDQPEAFEVINTCSWSRSGLVILPEDWHLQDADIYDHEGSKMTVQPLSDETFAFLAKDIPPMGSVVYTIKRNAEKISKNLNNNNTASANSLIELSIDSNSGAIAGLTTKDNSVNLVDTATWKGLNQYLYVSGRIPDHPFGINESGIEIIDDGPVLQSFLITSSPPGCNSMKTIVRLATGQDRIEIINNIGKKKICEPEGVYFAFPFAIPDGVMRYDLAFGSCRVEDDQMKGSNKNFITMENWVDISNDKYGITVASPDAPLIEAGTITMDAIITGWLQHIPPTQTFFSYVMNNYWETNFAASQEGNITFRYVIHPHKVFNEAEAEKFGMEQRQPLIVIPAGSRQRGKAKSASGGSAVTSQFKISNNNIIIVSIKPLTREVEEYLITLYNSSDQHEILQWDKLPRQIWLSDPDGITQEEPGSPMEFPAYGIRFIKLRMEN